MLSIQDQPFPILSGHTPSPGSNRHFQKMLDRGITTFNPDAFIKDFYRSAVEKNARPLRVKTEYTPSTTMVFPDSNIYGAIEPNLLLQTEILTAHYLILSGQQREIVELRLVHGLEWIEVAQKLNKGVRMVQLIFARAMAGLRSYVFYDEEPTWNLPPQKQSQKCQRPPHHAFASV